MEELVSSVSPKGQITIPVKVRRLMGIKPKDKVTFFIEGEEIRIAPTSSGLAASYQSVPALQPPRSSEELTEVAWEEHATHVVGEGL